jgi:hypothetical protein
MRNNPHKKETLPSMPSYYDLFLPNVLNPEYNELAAYDGELKTQLALPYL